jgi:hypothetical protein
VKKKVILRSLLVGKQIGIAIGGSEVIGAEIEAS